MGIADVLGRQRPTATFGLASPLLKMLQRRARPPHWQADENLRKLPYTTDGRRNRPPGSPMYGVYWQTALNARTQTGLRQSPKPPPVHHGCRLNYLEWITG